MKQIRAGVVAGLGLLFLAALGSGVAGAKPGGSADLQWAQEVLKERGFDTGRPSGEMTPKTRAALSAFQRSGGLPVTGELDAATTAALMAGRPAPAHAGTLGVTAGGTAGAVAPHPTQGSVPHGAALAPRAAPSGRIDSVGVAGAGAALPVAGPAAALMAGQGASVEPDPAAESSWLEVSSRVRSALIGTILFIFAGFGVLWWRSGRKPGVRRHRGPPTRAGGGAVRVEPSFGPSEPEREDRHALRVRRL
ncbi:MAG: peptidoglycan-binding domain-containing protein [Rhodospirillaceae bacterium]